MLDNILKVPENPTVGKKIMGPKRVVFFLFSPCISEK